PMAWLPVAQAVTTAEFGPLRPYRIESCPDTMLTMRAGMKNGEIRSGPRSFSTSCHCRIVWIPPMPEPTRLPARFGSTWAWSSLASSTASAPAPSAYWMNRSSFLRSFFSMTRRGSKPFTSPAMRESRRLASNRVMGPMPERPSQIALQNSGTVLPTGVTAPSPVTTTRGFSVSTAVTPRPLPSLGVLDVLDGVPDRGDLLGVLVRDLQVELLLERHHQLDGVERVGAEIL